MSGCVSSNVSVCGVSELASRGNFKSLSDLVDDYIAVYRDKEEHALAYYSNICLDTAIERAIKSEDENGKINSHQRRIGRERLSQATPSFVNEIERYSAASSFAEIFQITSRITSQVGGLGELAAYDFSVRIAHSRNIAPRDIYIHCGTRDGAEKLGMRTSKIIPRKEIVRQYPDLDRLTADEIESFLCIYKTQLGKFRA